MDKQEIDNWLEQRLPKVRKNLSIHTQEEVGGLYHLSTNGKIKDFLGFILVVLVIVASWIIYFKFC